MEREELKNLCPNCKREVLASNFLVHTSHCQRNIVLCKKCENPIPRGEIEAHNAENHAAIRCDKCFREMEKQELEDHKEKSCSKRLVHCEFCGIDAVASDIEEHEDYCGSRTEVCDGCGQYVMLKHQQLHLVSDHCIISPDDSFSPWDKSDGRPSFNASKTHPVSSEKVNSDKRTNHQPQVNKYFGIETEKEVPKPGLSRLVDDVPVEGGTGSLSAEELDHLLAMHMAEDEELSNLFASKASSANDDDLPTSRSRRPDCFLPPIPSPPFRPITKFTPESTDPRMVANIYEDPDRSSKNNLVQDGGTVFVPCEVCSELFPIDNIDIHQTQCQLMIYGQERNFTTYDPPERLPESDAVRQMNNVAARVNEDPRNLPNEDEHVVIPCEYCGDPFPMELVEDHQRHCTGTSLMHTKPSPVQRETPARVIGASQWQQPHEDEDDDDFTKNQIEQAIKKSLLDSSPPVDATRTDSESRPVISRVLSSSPPLRFLQRQLIPEDSLLNEHLKSQSTLDHRDHKIQSNTWNETEQSKVRVVPIRVDPLHPSVACTGSSSSRRVAMKPPPMQVHDSNVTNRDPPGASSSSSYKSPFAINNLVSETPRLVGARPKILARNSNDTSSNTPMGSTDNVRPVVRSSYVTPVEKSKRSPVTSPPKRMPQPRNQDSNRYVEIPELYRPKPTSRSGQT